MKRAASREEEKRIMGNDGRNEKQSRSPWSEVKKRKVLSRVFSQVDGVWDGVSDRWRICNTGCELSGKSSFSYHLQTFFVRWVVTTLRGWWVSEFHTGKLEQGSCNQTHLKLIHSDSNIKFSLYWRQDLILDSIFWGKYCCFTIGTFCLFAAAFSFYNLNNCSDSCCLWQQIEPHCCCVVSCCRYNHILVTAELKQFPAFPSSHNHPFSLWWCTCKK